jgi:hypothetical protein
MCKRDNFFQEIWGNFFSTDFAVDESTRQVERELARAPERARARELQIRD